MATETKYAGAKAPRVQKGVSRQLPEGYGGPFVGWIGKASDAIAYSTVFVKLPMGFKATKYVFEVAPLADRANPPHTVLSGSDPVVSTLVPDGKITLGATDTVQVYGATMKMTGEDPSTATSTGASGAVTIGSSSSKVSLTAAAPIQTGSVGSPVRVANDESYVQLTVGSAATLVGDAWLKALVYLEQIDPEPEKRF